MEELKLSLNTIEVLKRRYLLKDDNRNIIERPDELFRRVAHHIAKAEASYKSDVSPSLAEEKFYLMMRNLEFLPNSPTLMNAGTTFGQLSACFVLPIEDSIDGIFKSLRGMAKIHQTGGGTGFSFSNLRPKGDLVYSTKGEASGPVSFMSIFDQATGVIVQGGRRRGANMGILRCDHPDIVGFIRAKDEEGAFSNFNLSVGVTDEFMNSVLKRKRFVLVNPRTKKVTGYVDARTLFDILAKSAWKTGDPGVVFLDEINRKHPLRGLGYVEATNPCLTSENWIMTSDGPRKLKELIGKNFSILVNGETYLTGRNGFFSTGKRAVFKLITKEGYELEGTEDHLILKVEEITRYKIKTAWARVKDLKRGDNVVINNHRNFKGWPGEYGEKEGYLIGLLVGDGVLTSERVMLLSWDKVEGAEEMRNIAYAYLDSFPHRSDFKGWVRSSGKGVYRLSTSYLKELALKLGLTPQKKMLTEKIEMCSFRFYQGFLRGLFDADGAVIGNQTKGVSVRLAQSDYKTLQAVQRMLLRLGIGSVIYKNRRPEGLRSLPDGGGKLKSYLCKAQHELVISNENILYFAERVGFNDSKKAEKLDKIIKKYKRKVNRERFIATIEKIVFTGRKHTFDLRVLDVNRFDANGFIVHNCGELPLLPFESCNLASINLSKMVSDGKIDWQRLKKIVHLGIRFLDNVIEVNKFPLREIKEITLANRKIGLGMMGFADMLIKLEVPYTSFKAVKLAEEIMRFIHKESMLASQKLAEERGTFINFKRSIYAKKNIRMRNATVNTIAPTGTISIIAGCSSGIEPLFALSFVRNILSGMKLLEVNHLFESEMKKSGLHTKKLMSEVAKDGSIQNIKRIPKDLKKIFVTAFDVAPRQHVKIQAAFQKYTDNSVSKTINLPEGATVEDVKDIYLMAYKLKCKGITIYRYGSKKNQVLTFGYGKNVKVEAGNNFVTANSEYSGGCATGICAF